MLESVRGPLANSPILHPPEESSFIRQDDYWRIRYNGYTVLLKSSRGLQCLSILLGSPEREFHVCELLSNLPERPAAASAVTSRGRLCEDGGLFTSAELNGGSPILDARAKAEYKSRVNELRQNSKKQNNSTTLTGEWRLLSA